MYHFTKKGDTPSTFDDGILLLDGGGVFSDSNTYMSIGFAHTFNNLFSLASL